MDSSSREIKGGDRGESEADAQASRLILPVDEYEWRKYGQKFIRNIGKNRSYYKCKRSDCSARKKADWSTSEPRFVRVEYEGVHNHAPPATESQTPSLRGNQYDLWTQVFGDRSTSSHDNEQVTRDQSTSHHENDN